MPKGKPEPPRSDPDAWMGVDGGNTPVVVFSKDGRAHRIERPRQGNGGDTEPAGPPMEVLRGTATDVAAMMGEAGGRNTEEGVGGASAEGEGTPSPADLALYEKKCTDFRGYLAVLSQSQPARHLRDLMRKKGFDLFGFRKHEIERLKMVLIGDAMNRAAELVINVHVVVNAQTGSLEVIVGPYRRPGHV